MASFCQEFQIVSQIKSDFIFYLIFYAKGFMKIQAANSIVLALPHVTFSWVSVSTYMYSSFVFSSCEFHRYKWSVIV